MRSLHVSLLALLVFPSIGLASTAPTTPTFALAWGTNGLAPGQFAYPTGAATDALGNVYVVDAGNNRVQKFDRYGNFLLQWGSFGSGAGQLSNPLNLTVDRNGNVFVADQDNNRIQKFSGAGVYLAQWGSFGTGNGQFRGPAAVATDATGNVYVADRINHRIQKFTSGGTYVAQWGVLGTGNGQFSNPYGVGTDPAGNVYVADTDNHRVQKFTAAGAYVTQWGSNGSGDGQFNRPAAVTTDGVGNVYVSDEFNNRIQKFKSDGTYLTKWGSNGSGSGQFSFQFGLCLDAAGNVYVADQNNHRIQKFSGAGAALAEAPPKFLLKWGSLGGGTGQFWYPSGVATDAAGNVYVADQGNHRIQKFSPAGNYVTHWGGNGSGNGQFNFPYGVATDAAGNVYVADTFNHRIQKFSSAGTYLTQWGSYGGGNGQLNTPVGVGTDAAGNVYVADLVNYRIQKFSGTGTYLTQWGSPGSGNGQFDSPYDVAIDPAGNVYVAEFGNNRIQKFSGTGTYVTQWGGFIATSGVATDAAGNVYVADQSNQIHKFTGAGAPLTQWGSTGSGDGQFSVPWDVAVDAAGNLYVSDQYNHRIQKFASPPAIALVSDVGNDQGRQVRLRILRGSTDASGSSAPVVRYDVYRRIDPIAAAVSGVGSGGTTDPAASGPESVQLAGWEQVGSISARGDAEYNVVVPTLINATGSSLEYSAFFVSAATVDPLSYFDSGVENGFSVDNLSPPAPTPFAAAYATGATHLHWGVSTATDFASFRLYRGASSDFVPGSGNLVTATPDTGYVDSGAAGSWYKLSAVDLDGNESLFAVVGPGQTTSAPQTSSPLSLALEPIRPNPCRAGELSVRFTLPVATPARIELLDLAGRRVLSRAVAAGPGAQSLALTSERPVRAGLYFVRLVQGAHARTERVVLID